MFKVGQEVILYLTGAGFTTNEETTILEIKGNNVWTDNGPGNDPGGPFNFKDGLYGGNTMPGFTQRIKEINNV